MIKSTAAPLYAIIIACSVSACQTTNPQGDSGRRSFFSVKERQTVNSCKFYSINTGRRQLPWIYFNIGENEYSEKYFWSGECQNGFAHGYGELVEIKSQYGNLPGREKWRHAEKFYVGEMKNGLPSGHGILSTINAIVDGIFIDGTLKEGRRIFDDGGGMWENGSERIEMRANGKLVVNNSTEKDYPTKNCRVTGLYIIIEHSGECKDGYAEGQGIARGANIYEGNFRRGSMSGSGKYTWAGGAVYTGEFSNDMLHGMGVLEIPWHNFAFRSGPWKIENWPTGSWVNDVYTIRGVWASGVYLGSCTKKTDCDKMIVAKQKNDREESQEKYEKQCDRYYPGRVGEIKDNSFLATSDKYVVRYVNKDRRMVTIEGTAGGNSLKYGEMRELSCLQLQRFDQ